MQSRNGSLEQWAIVANSSWMHGKRYDISEGTLTIGRSAQADITLPSNHLSRRHAQLQRTGNAVMLQDMASMNGTFVNGNRVKKVPIKHGDQLRFDTFTFLVEGPHEGQETIIRRPKKTPFAAAKKSAAKIVKVKMTRPTSPGNRLEPGRKRRPQAFTIAASTLTAGCIGYLIYLVFFS